MVCKDKWAQWAQDLKDITGMAVGSVDGAARCMVCNRPLTRGGKCPKGHAQTGRPLAVDRGRYGYEISAGLQCVLQDLLEDGLVRDGERHPDWQAAREFLDSGSARFLPDDYSVGVVGRLLRVFDNLQGDGYSQEEDPRVQAARRFFQEASAGIAAGRTGADPTREALLDVLDEIAQSPQEQLATLGSHPVVPRSTVERLQHLVAEYRPTPYRLEGGRKVRPQGTPPQMARAAELRARNGGILLGTLLDSTLDVAEDVGRAALPTEGEVPLLVTPGQIVRLRQAIAFYRPGPAQESPSAVQPPPQEGHSMAFVYPEVDPPPEDVADEVQHLLRQITGLTFHVQAGQGAYEDCVAVHPEEGGQFGRREGEALLQHLGWDVSGDPGRPCHPLPHQGTGKLLVALRARFAAQQAMGICAQHDLDVEVQPQPGRQGVALWLRVDPEGDRAWETRQILEEMGLQTSRVGNRDVAEVPAEEAPEWVEQLREHITAGQEKFFAAHGRPYHRVWDGETQAWWTIRERDGRLYGFPDSSQDGTLVGEIAFLGGQDLREDTR